VTQTFPSAKRLGRCPACGVAGGAPITRSTRVRLVRCPACTLVYTDPQRLAEVYARYLHEYDLAVHFDAVIDRKRILFKRRLERLGPPRLGADRLCDVGCAGGQFLSAAQAAGWKASGIELNPPAAARARATGATIYDGALEDLNDLPWESFNVVTCWDVLEHTPVPASFAHNAVRLMVPGGVLAVTTLNWGALVRRILGPRWSMIADEHFSYWTRKALCELFDRHNLSPISIETFGLGRDLVRPLDIVVKRIRRVGSSRHGSVWHASWDTNRVILAAERAANAALRGTDSGVGLAAFFRSPI